MNTLSYHSQTKIFALALATLLLLALPFSVARADSEDYLGVWDIGSDYSYSPDTSYSYSPDTSYSYSPDTYSYSYPDYTSYDSYDYGYSAGYGGFGGGFSFPFGFGGSGGSSRSNSNTNIVTNTNTCTNGSCNTAINAPTTITTNTTGGGGYPVYYPSQPVYQPVYYPQPTCNTCGCNNTYCQPIAYNQAPYVSLSAVPYTGLDLGPWGTAAYWGFLVLWCLGAAYLIVVKRVQNKLVSGLNAFLFGSAGKQPAAHATHAPVHTAHAAVSEQPASVSKFGNIDPFIASQLNRLV